MVVRGEEVDSKLDWKELCDDDVSRMEAEHKAYETKIAGLKQEVKELQEQLDKRREVIDGLVVRLDGYETWGV